MGSNAFRISVFGAWLGLTSGNWLAGLVRSFDPQTAERPLEVEATGSELGLTWNSGGSHCCTRK